MINQFSKQIINLIVAKSKQCVDIEQLEIYIYGLECFINTAVPVIILTIFSIFSNTLFETWLWIIIFSILRKYTGGYHAPSQWICMLSTISLGVINTLVIRYCSLYWTCCILWYIIYAILIIFLCPIKSHKKKLTSLQRKYHKYYALGIATMILLLSSYLPNTYAITLIYSGASCLCLVIIELVNRAIIQNTMAMY